MNYFKETCITGDENRPLLFNKEIGVLSLIESGVFSEDEMKAATRLLGDGADFGKKALKESAEIWNRIKIIALARKQAWKTELPNLPTGAPGLIAKPKMAAQAIIQGCEQAVENINEMLEILTVAIARMKEQPKGDPYEDNEETPSSVQSVGNLRVAIGI